MGFLEFEVGLRGMSYWGYFVLGAWFGTVVMKLLFLVVVREFNWLELWLVVGFMEKIGVTDMVKNRKTKG